MTRLTRSRTGSSETTVPNGSSSQRNTQDRVVASSSIEKFARSSTRDSQLPISSTPTGLPAVIPTENGQEHWPGPFSTARTMLAKREEAKQKRLARLASIEGGSAMTVDEEDFDEYDAILQSLEQLPVSQAQSMHKRAGAGTSTRPVSVSIPSLQALCVEFVVRNFESITDLGPLSCDVREELSNRLGQMRQLTHAAALTLVSPGMQTLRLAECSEISEDTIIQVLEKVCSVESVDPNPHAEAEVAIRHKRKRKTEEEDDGPGLFTGLIRVLFLRNCGPCFGDRAALTLAHLGDPQSGPGLLDLSLHGCYRLADSSLSNLLSRCQGLRSLDLTCYSRLGMGGLRAISELPVLEELRLSSCSQLRDDDLLVLSGGCPVLTGLHLDGLALVTDAALDSLLRSHGPRLRQLSLKDCVGLTDAAAVCVRTRCRTLTVLDVSGLSLSTEALLGLFVADPPPSPPDTAAADSSTSATTDTTLGDTLGRLERFRARGLPNVTDDVLQLLCRSSADSLLELDVSGCAQLTSRAVAILLAHCSRSISVLDISFVRGVSEQALAALCRRCSGLQTLHVWGCSQLSDAFFNDISLNQGLAVRGRPA